MNLGYLLKFSHFIKLQLKFSIICLIPLKAKISGSFLLYPTVLMLIAYILTKKIEAQPFSIAFCKESSTKKGPTYI